MFNFDHLSREARITCFKSLHFVLTRSAIFLAFQQVKDIIDAAGKGVDGFNDIEAATEEKEMNRRLRSQQGFEETLTLDQTAELTAALRDDLLTYSLGSPFDKAQSVEDIYARTVDKPFDPSSKFGQAAIRREAEAWDVDTEHAKARCIARSANISARVHEYKNEILDTIDELEGRGSDQSFEDLFEHLPKGTQMRMFQTMARSLENEAERYKQLDLKYSGWDDMLTKRKLLLADLEQFIMPQIKQLVHTESGAPATQLPSIDKEAEKRARFAEAVRTTAAAGAVGKALKDAVVA